MRKERKFIYGKAFGNGDNYKIYNIIDKNIDYFEMMFNDVLQEKKFDTLKSAIKEGEEIFKTKNGRNVYEKENY